MPEYPYVINLAEPFAHYRYRMHQEDLAKQFGRFYKESMGMAGQSACLVCGRMSLCSGTAICK
ncbi:MAG: hypothetical protein ACLR0U_07115 [Enterocloster clostridioformis]